MLLESDTKQLVLARLLKLKLLTRRSSRRRRTGATVVAHVAIGDLNQESASALLYESRASSGPSVDRRVALDMKLPVTLVVIELEVTAVHSDRPGTTGQRDTVLAEKVIASGYVYKDHVLIGGVILETKRVHGDRERAGRHVPGRVSRGTCHSRCPGRES